jgi:nicotinamidase-related amidase
VDGVIHKRHGSAFQGTSLGEALALHSVERLVVTGLVTRGCVRATCLDALKQGYEVVLARDGHSTFSADAAKRIEQWNVKLADAGVQVIPAQEIAYG